MSDELTKQFEDYKSDLEKIIIKAVPLRDPAISIIKIPVNYIEEIYRKQIILFRKLKEQHPDWNYTILNVEKIFYEFLKKRRYIEKQSFARTMERANFSVKIRGSIVNDLVDRIEKEIKLLKENSTSNKHPPFLTLLNMHSTYPYIETGDVISRIINEKGVYVLILYIQRLKFSQEDSEPYKTANYTVHSYSLV